MLDDAEGLPSHYCAGLITHLGASLGGKETEVEAGEHLPTPLTFCYQQGRRQQDSVRELDSQRLSI